MGIDAACVLPDAFAPRVAKNAGDPSDADGLSVYRASFHSPEEIACLLRTGGSQPVWIAQLTAADVFALGLSIKPDPLPAESHPRGIVQPGHALLVELHSGEAKTARGLEWKQALAALANSLPRFGPFAPPPAI